LVTSDKGRVRVSQRGNVITFSEEPVRLLKTFAAQADVLEPTNPAGAHRRNGSGGS
jgi:hypothetical protein